jgi:hypothetical protein
VGGRASRSGTTISGRAAACSCRPTRPPRARARARTPEMGRMPTRP